jgi:hypothetical protein
MSGYDTYLEEARRLIDSEVANFMPRIADLELKKLCMFCKRKESDLDLFWSCSAPKALEGILSL